MARHTEKANPITADVTRPNRTALDGEDVWQAKVELAACFRFAARLGMEEGICNHFSLMVPGYDDLFLVNPYGYAFSEITASRLLVCDFDGNVVSGTGEPEATAFYIHARVHKRIPRARGVSYSHALRDGTNHGGRRSIGLCRPDGLKVLRSNRRGQRLQWFGARRTRGRPDCRLSRRCRCSIHEASWRYGAWRLGSRSLGRALPH